MGRNPAPSFPLSQQLVQRQLLEDKVSLAAFVDDSNVGSVDTGHGWIPVAAAFVEQQPVLLRPGAAVVEADLDRVVITARLRMRVGEEQDVLRFSILLVIEA